MKLARALRWLAIAIAVAAVIDPSITSRRRADAIVSVISSDGVQDSLLAQHVRDELDERFTVIDAPFPAAAATVTVGSTLPRNAASSGGSAFALLPDSTAPYVAIVDVSAPATAPEHARIDTRVSIAGEASRADSVDVHPRWYRHHPSARARRAAPVHARRSRGCHYRRSRCDLERALP
jgi:hypothetical protein